MWEGKQTRSSICNSAKSEAPPGEQGGPLPCLLSLAARLQPAAADLVLPPETERRRSSLKTTCKKIPSLLCRLHKLKEGVTSFKNIKNLYKKTLSSS